jgi:hypothetical protein
MRRRAVKAVELANLSGVIEQAQRSIDEPPDPHLACSLLRHTGLSVSRCVNQQRRPGR